MNAAAAPCVWVAGASGLVGRELVAALTRSGCAVHALVRRPTAFDCAPLPTQHLVQLDRADWSAKLPSAQQVFIALGTTIAQAGSQAAFRAVDLDAVLAVAQAARQRGARACAVVSALGADAASSVFYNQIKGQMEQALAALGFEHLVIARPSLLLGDRASLGQAARPGEHWALRLTQPLLPLIPKRWRPIRAQQVASAMLQAMASGARGIQVLESAQLQELSS